MLSMMLKYVAEYVQIRGDLEAADVDSTQLVRWSVVFVRSFLCLGALVFMWQVRHAKTE